MIKTWVFLGWCIGQAGHYLFGYASAEHSVGRVILAGAVLLSVYLAERIAVKP